MATPYDYGYAVLDYNGRPIRVARFNAAGTALVGLSGEEFAPWNTLQSAKGRTVVDFSDPVPWTQIATQNTCTYQHNPTGWHDGTGCLEIVGDAEDLGWIELRMYFDSGRHFQLDSEDGFAVEFELPDMSDITAANNSFGIEMGKGASSAAVVPADRWSNTLFVQQNGATLHNHGVFYQRCRFDTDTTDAKAGPWPGYNDAISGAGIAQNDTVNWLRFLWGSLPSRTIKIKRIVVGGRSEAGLVLVWDSIQGHHANRISQRLAKYGLKGNFCSTLNDTILPYTSSISSVNRMNAAGHAFLPNDMVDRNLATSGLTQAEVYSMLKELDAALASRGWDRGRGIYVYNNNAYNTAVVNALEQAGYRAARAGATEGRYVFTEGGVKNPFRLPSVGADSKTVAKQLEYIDRGIEYGASLWLYMHNLFTKAQVAYDGQPAVGATETCSEYAVRNPSYCATKGINSSYNWVEDVESLIDEIAERVAGRTLKVFDGAGWCNAVGL